MEEKKEQLYIPLNVRKRKELFAGYGQQELIITVVMAIIGFVVGSMIYAFNGKIEYLLITPIVIGFLTVVTIVKDQTNTSLLDSLIRLYQFSKSQKKFYYKYKNIYEGEEHETTKSESGSKDPDRK